MDDFIERQNQFNPASPPARDGKDGSDDPSYACDSESELAANKAGQVSLQEAAIQKQASLKEAQDCMTALSNPVVRESTLPLSALFNPKFERIRFIEYETERPP